MARRYRRPDLDSPFWWFTALVALVWYTGVLAFFLLIAVFYVLAGVIWLIWALIAVPAGMIARLAGHDDLALSIGRSIRWKILGFR